MAQKCYNLESRKEPHNIFFKYKNEEKIDKKKVKSPDASFAAISYTTKTPIFPKRGENIENHFDKLVLKTHC